MRIWLSRPHMGGQERTYVDAAFESNFVAPVGPQLTQFEQQISEYFGSGVHCCAVSSGTAALHLAMRIIEVGSGSEVWVSSMTFAGGVFPVLYQGGTPVFFDLDPASWTIDPEVLEEELQRASTKGRLPAAIVPADLYGQSCNLGRLEAIAAEFGVPLIVDSAESLGAEYLGRKAGTGGDASILSFNGNKIITTGGGGMLVSRSRELIERARFLSSQARDPAPHYQHSTYGYNYRMGNISAAIGLGQLEVLNRRVERRRQIFRKYANDLGYLAGVSFMPEPEWSYSTRWLSVMRIDPDQAGVSRENVRLALLEREIEARPLWKPMHLQPLFADCRYHGRRFDESLFQAGLCLPSSSDMTSEEQDEVVTCVREVLERA